jgi:hypothetical protein
MREDLNHAGDGVGAIEGAFGAPDDFNFVDVIEREVREVDLAAGIVDGGAVDQNFGVIGVAAIEEEGCEAAFGGIFSDGDTWRVQEDIGERNGLALVNFLTRDYGDRGGGVLYRCGLRLRGDDDAFGKTLEVQAHVEHAGLAGDKVEGDLTRGECGSRIGDVVAAWRDAQRVGAVTRRGGAVFLCPGVFEFGGDVNVGYRGATGVEQGAGQTSIGLLGLCLCWR